MPSPTDNQILAALPDEEATRLFPQLTLIEFPLGMSVYESGDVQRYIYFPTDSIVSLLYVLKDGASAEIAIEVPAERLRYWDEATKQYVVEPGDYELLVGAAADDIRLKLPFTITGR